MNGFVVRRAELTNLQAILLIEQSSREAPHWNGATWVDAFKNEAPRRVVFVAERSGAIRGYAVLSYVSGVAELENIAVDLALRRQGMGRALCEAGIAWARECAAGEVQLEVRLSSEGAQKMYRDLGFVEDGRRPRYYSDPVEDAVAMVLRLIGE